MKPFLLVCFLCSFFCVRSQFHTATPPVADKKPHWRVIHGDSTLDNYYWMYDYFGKGPDSTRAVEYLVKENAYCDSVMSGTVPLQQKLFAEMRARIQEKDESAPVYQNGYFYYSRTDSGSQYFKYCRRKGSMNSAEELLLDVDAMAAGHPYYSISAAVVSPDNRLLAYCLDDVSRRQYTIRIKDLHNDSLLTDSILNTSGEVAWAADNRTLFYATKNPVTLLPEKIMRHRLGESASADSMVYEEKDPTNFLSLEKSKNERYILIVSQSTLSSEVRYIDAGHPQRAATVFAPRMSNVLYSVYPMNDRFLILTNKDSAINFKVMECPLKATGPERWKPVIRPRNDVLIEDIEPFKDFVALHERGGGLEHFRIVNLSNRASVLIPFEEPSYAAAFDLNPEFNSHTLRYSYTSLKTPFTIYDYDMTTHRRTLVKPDAVLGGYDPDNYSVERIAATAPDGTHVPISIVYRKGLKKDGTAPLLLYGYGSYGISVDDNFSSRLVSMLDRGFVYAIAHIRGGQEMGRSWFEEARLMKKKNSFTDFIACGEQLVKLKYTSPAHLYAHGGSAGGMLMGAVFNMAPALWHGVIAEVPFVDVVNTMLDENIPLTTNEFDQWGNPKEEAAYRYMKSYSPYENVAATSYPHLLVLTGLHDSQVQYFEPAKWVAKLRATKKDDHLVLLHTNMDYGHGGASGRFDHLTDLSLKYAFLLTLENIYR